MYYGEECRGKSDHYPQVLEIGEGDKPRLAQPAGWAWKKMDKKRVAAESKLLYKAMGLTDPDLSQLTVKIQTIEDLDRAFNDLVNWLTWVAGESTPRKKANCGFSSPWWSREVQQASQEARRAERIAKETCIDYYQEELDKRHKKLTRAIQEVRTRA